MSTSGRHRKPKRSTVVVAASAIGSIGATVVLPIVLASGASATPVPAQLHAVVAAMAVKPVEAAPKVVKAAPAPKVAPKVVKTAVTQTYTVKPGDCVSEIAFKNGLWDKSGWEDFYNANKNVIGGNANLIFPGQVFELTDGTSTAPTPMPPVVTPTPPTPAPVPAPSTPSNSGTEAEDGGSDVGGDGGSTSVTPPSTEGEDGGSDSGSSGGGVVVTPPPVSTPPSGGGTSIAPYPLSAGCGNMSIWLADAHTILAADGHPFPASWDSGLESLALAESSCDPSAVNNYDSNAQAGNPSEGLMQTIIGTFYAYPVPGYNTSPYRSNPMLDPVVDLVHAIRYIQDQYGYVPSSPY